MQLEVYDQIVATVSAEFALAFPGVDLVQDNAPFDWNNPPKRFVSLEIIFYGANQIDMSAAPRTRLRGYLYVSAYAKRGLGSQWGRRVTDWFAVRFKYASLGPARFQEPLPDGNAERKDFYIEQLKVAFYADAA